MAQARVRRSPNPIVAKMYLMCVPEGVVRSKRPAKARSAPKAAFQRGARAPTGRSKGKAVRIGTKTTTSPVMKADLAGVVRARPAV